MSESRKRRASEHDDEAASKLHHRLFSFPRKTRASGASPPLQLEERKRKKSSSEEENLTNSSIAVLEGITRGSIANMVLARLGKLNPDELIGPAPSKPPCVSQFQESDGSEDDDEEEEEDDDNDDDDENEEYNDETGSDQKQKSSTTESKCVVRGKEEITFHSTVRPQPSNLPRTEKQWIGTYGIRSGPYAGARGKLHPTEAPGYFILETYDGRVATVNESQLSKSSSGITRSRMPAKKKLRKEIKKQFMDGLKIFLAEDKRKSSSFRLQVGGAPIPLSHPDPVSALRIAVNTLDPKREIFRPKSSRKYSKR